MGDLNLCDDLVEFLRAGRQLRYDPGVCEVGTVTMLPLDALRVELFPMTETGPEDPHRGESGCWLVRGVSLLATCEAYDPVGLLLWLPLDERYGTWDGEHGTLRVFAADVNWQQVASDFPRYINAQWDLDGAALLTDLTPWQRHTYNAEQAHHPLPDIAEWYEAKWVRRGVYRDGVQLRYPEEMRIRIERIDDRCEAIAEVKKAEPDADWSMPIRQVVMLEELARMQPALEAGFWNQPSMASGSHARETDTMWSVSGYRAGMYHKLFRSYDEGGSEGDAVHEMGKQAARLARIPRFEP
jgi:hypothetical protein